MEGRLLLVDDDPGVAKPFDVMHLAQVVVAGLLHGAPSRDGGAPAG